MAEEKYSIYQWVLGNGDVNFDNPNVTYDGDGDLTNITVKATITNNNIFAIIAGTYQVDVTVEYKYTGQGDITENLLLPVTFKCTSEVFSKPVLCTKNGTNTIEIDFTLDKTNNDNSKLSNINKKNYMLTWEASNLIVQQGVNNEPNNYLYVLKSPELITSLSIDGEPASNTYVKGSALPINEIKNISTKDFNNIKINDVQHDIFYKLNNTDGEAIVTKDLFVNELTVVDLPEEDGEQIVICKSRSKNKGVTFKTKDPDIGNKHFGYIIDIEGDRSAGYNSVWVNRETLDKMFIGLPADIMSNTQMFECTDSFNFHKLTYEVHNVVAPDWVNNQGQEFSEDDIEKLNNYALTYTAVTINESTGDPIRHNNMILKNIEFVKFGEKVIKLNYKPLYEA